MQVVDGKYSESLFKAEELDYSQGIQTIVTCEDCGKKRLLFQDLPPENNKWVCSMNADKRFNKCVTAEQRGLTKIRRGPLPIRNNPFLEYITGVINKKTKTTTPIVVDYIPVQITHETDLCCEDAIKRLKEEIYGVRRPKTTTEKVEFRSAMDTQEVTVRLKDSTKNMSKANKECSQEAVSKQNTIVSKDPSSGNETKPEPKELSSGKIETSSDMDTQQIKSVNVEGKTNEGSPQEAVTKSNATISKAPSSGNDEEREIKESTKNIEISEKSTTAAQRDSLDIISISSSDEDDPDQSPPCKKRVRHGNNQDDTVGGGENASPNLSDNSTGFASTNVSPTLASPGENFVLQAQKRQQRRRRQQQQQQQQNWCRPDQVFSVHGDHHHGSFGGLQPRGYPNGQQYMLMQQQQQQQKQQHQDWYRPDQVLSVHGGRFGGMNHPQAGHFGQQHWIPQGNGNGMRTGQHQPQELTPQELAMIQNHRQQQQQQQQQNPPGTIPRYNKWT